MTDDHQVGAALIEAQTHSNAYLCEDKKDTQKFEKWMHGVQAKKAEGKRPTSNDAQTCLGDQWSAYIDYPRLVFGLSAECSGGESSWQC